MAIDHMKEVNKKVDTSEASDKNFHSPTPAQAVPHGFPNERRGDIPPELRKKTTILTLNNQKKKGIKTVGVTAYDYPQALLADKAGVDWILVGDSIGMTTLGYKTTIPVTMDDMLRSANAVSRGVTRALALGPFGIPLAGLIAGLGAVQIATIASQKYQGRRLGGRMNQNQPYMVGEAGPELVVPDRPSNVVPNSQLSGGQGVTVNFNISTVDARGFNELLVNSRGTIVNMINNAVNEKGKMAII